MFGEEKAFDIMGKALAFSRADQTQILLIGEKSAMTRYANSQIHQNMAQKNVSVYFRVVMGNRQGWVQINAHNPQRLRDGANMACEMALKQKENPHPIDLPEPEKYRRIRIYYPDTAKYSSMRKAEDIQRMVQEAGARGAMISGTYQFNEREIAIMNSKGVKNYEVMTRANLMCIARTNGLTGYAQAAVRNIRDLNPRKVAEEAVDAASAGMKIIEIPPGEYPVILEEYAAADIIPYFVGMGFTAPAVEEGFSFVGDHWGEQVVSEKVSIWDDALNPQSLAFPFDFEGTPKRKLAFLDNGIARGIAHDCFSAGKVGAKTTGHAVLPRFGHCDPFPQHLCMKTGKHSFADLLKSMGTGLVVKRFHYLTAVHPRKTLISGMTRDGFYWVENGEITARVKNMRFTQSIAEALSNLGGLSNTSRLVVSGEFADEFLMSSIMPKIFITKFNFTGKTEY